MNLVTVREIYRSREAYLDKEIQIGGWVRSVRGSKAFGFVVVSDGSYFETLQIVYHDTLEKLFRYIQAECRGCIIVKGKLVAHAGSKTAF